MGKHASFWLTLLVVLAVRVLLVLSRLDELELEIYSGSIAVALLEGLPLNPERLPIIVHMRGSFLMGLLAAPLVALFGAKLWVLKIVAVAWCLVTVGLWMSALRVSLGFRAACVGGLVYAFMPPSFLMVDILLLGSHGQTILFMVAALLFVLSRKQSMLEQRSSLLAFGTLLGAGFLFSMQFLGVIPALVIAWWCHERQWQRGADAVRESLTVCVPGLILAAVVLMQVGPLVAESLGLWWQMLLVGGLCLGVGLTFKRLRMLSVVGGFFLACWPMPFLTRSTKVVKRSLEDRLLTDGAGGFFEKFVHTVTNEFHESWMFSTSGGPVAYALFGGATLVGLGFVIKRAVARESLAVFLTLYPVFFFCLYAATDLELQTESIDGMGGRYLMPVMACVSGWIAVGFTDLARLCGLRIGALFAAMPVLAGLLGLLPLLEPSVAFKQPTPRASQFQRFGQHIGFAAGEQREARLEWIDRLDPEWAAFRPGYYRAILNVDTKRIKTTEQFVETLEWVLEQPLPLRSHYLLDMGSLAFEQKLIRDKILCAKVFEHMKRPELAWFGRGLGFAAIRFGFIAHIKANGVQMPPAGAFRSAKLLRLVPGSLHGYAMQGAGFADGAALTAHNAMPILSMRMIEQDFTGKKFENYFIGLGLGFRTRYFETSWFVPEPGDLRVERLMKEPARKAFRTGLSAPIGEFPAPL